MRTKTARWVAWCLSGQGRDLQSYLVNLPPQKEKVISFKDYIVFLIDARENMLENTPKGQSFLAAALGTVANVMKSHATGDTSARIAVMLMGTVRKGETDRPR